jgi:hypothetical protein
MFKNLFRLVYLTLLLSGWGLAALSLHVVRTPTTIGLLPKERLGVTDTYVDARTWTMADLPAHPDLIQRVLEANKADWFRYLADPNKGDVASQLSNAIQTAPAQKASALLGPLNSLFSPSNHPGRTASALDLSLPVDF